MSEVKVYYDNTDSVDRDGAEISIEVGRAGIGISVKEAKEVKKQLALVLRELKNGDKGNE